MQPLQKQLALVLMTFSAIAILGFANTVHADMCEPSWRSLASYKPGNKISFLEVNYRANYSSSGVVPSSNSGNGEQGKTWTKIGLCGARAKHEMSQVNESVAQTIAGR